MAELAIVGSACLDFQVASNLASHAGSLARPEQRGLNGSLNKGLMNIGSISATITGLKGAQDIAQAMLALKSISEIQGKVIDLQTQILSAQSSARDAQSEQFELRRKLDEFEKEISDLKGWTEQRSADELKALAALFQQ